MVFLIFPSNTNDLLVMWIINLYLAVKSYFGFQVLTAVLLRIPLFCVTKLRHSYRCSRSSKMKALRFFEASKRREPITHWLSVRNGILRFSLINFFGTVGPLEKSRNHHSRRQRGDMNSHSADPQILGIKAKQ